MQGPWGRSTGFLVLLVTASCGGRVGDGDATPTPTTSPTSTAFPLPTVPASDGGVAARAIPCTSGKLGSFSGEVPLHIAVSAETGAVVATSKDGAGLVHVRLLRDAKNGLEEIAAVKGGSGAVAASATHVAFADDTKTTVVALSGGTKRAFDTGAATFLGFRDKDLVVVTGAKVVRHPLDGSTAQPVCLGSTCTIAGIAAFDARAGTMAIIDTEGALYTGTDVGLRKVATGARAPLAVGAGFVAFVTGAAKDRRLAMFRPLEEETELFPLPARATPACGPTDVDVVGLASDGARLAFATKESYPCAESPESFAFASRAVRPYEANELTSAKGATAVASAATCVYALVEQAEGARTTTHVVAVEHVAR